VTLIQPVPRAAPRFPTQPLLHLDAVWIQVIGSRCNLTCAHCFVSSGPDASTHAALTRAQVVGHVLEAVGLGAREFYFTGGEPFLHPELIEILADTLAVAPCTVLTNGTLFTAARIETLRALSDASPYALEVRVSLDGDRAETHDALRGAGTFERALAGLRALDRAGLLPIVTVTQLDGHDPRERMRALLRDAGLRRPRVKVLPLFRLGRETGRDRPYSADETLDGLPTDAFDVARLQCGSCRAVTSRGTFVCPLLVDEPDARMGERLGDALDAFALRHGACHTCWVTGMTCANG
jgi:AdoMet-dependent heme synthase